RRAERAASAEAALRLAQTRLRQHEEAAQQAQETAVLRSERERTVVAETERLLTLTDAELIAEVTALFLRRGQQPEIPAPEADYDLLLPATDGTGPEIARCVPVGRSARAADVQALEAWRETARASHAYLIAVGGFTSGAIRLAQSLPLTLVEAHLLAHWK